MGHIERRRALRNKTRDDPFTPPPPPPEVDGTVQIGDGLAPTSPADLTYKDHSFGNPIKTAVLVAEAEAIRPDLDVGADKLAHHRLHLRSLCRPAASPSRSKSGSPVKSKGSD
jgi:hypothetical protein